MKRRNTLTAVLFLAFLAVGFWLLASAFIQGGALREQSKALPARTRCVTGSSRRPSVFSKRTRNVTLIM